MSDTAQSRWRGVGWFLLAAIAVLVAALMLFTEVRQGAGEDSPSCGHVLAPGGSVGADEDELRSAQCDAARTDRRSMSLATLAIAGFLAAAGIRGRFREHDRTVVGLGLFAIAAALLLWPVTINEGNNRCGAPLLRSSDQEFESEELAECAVDRTKRLAWVLVWFASGTLVLVSRRPAHSET
jgi:hypothetical protein